MIKYVTTFFNIFTLDWVPRDTCTKRTFPNFAFFFVSEDRPENRNAVLETSVVRFFRYSFLLKRFIRHAFFPPSFASFWHTHSTHVQIVIYYEIIYNQKQFRPFFCTRLNILFHFFCFSTLFFGDTLTCNEVRMRLQVRSKGRIFWKNYSKYILTIQPVWFCSHSSKIIEQGLVNRVHQHFQWDEIKNLHGYPNGYSILLHFDRMQHLLYELERSCSIKNLIQLAALLRERTMRMRFEATYTRRYRNFNCIQFFRMIFEQFNFLHHNIW